MNTTTLPASHDEVFNSMMSRLIRAHSGQVKLDQADMDFWGDRFVNLRIRFYAGCTFGQYLNGPRGWEYAARVVRSVVVLTEAKTLQHVREDGSVCEYSCKLN